MKKLICNIAILILSLTLLTASLCSCQLSKIFGDSETTEGRAELSVPETIALPEAMDLSGVDLSQYISVNYKGMKYSVSELPIKPDAAGVEKELKDMLVHYSYYDLDTAVEKTAAGDYIEIEYVGTMDGEKFQGGTSEKATILLDIENSGYIAGFADGLIDKKVGSDVQLNLKFPENYYAELAGKDVTFDVKIHGVCRVKDNDETATILSDGKYTTIEDYKVYFAEYLTEVSSKNAFSEIASTIWNDVVEGATVISYPEQQYNYLKGVITNNYIASAAQSGVDYNTFLTTNNITDESIDKEIKDILKEELVKNAIIKAENITVTEEEYSEYVNKYYAYYSQYLLPYGYTKEEIVNMLRDNALLEAVTYAVFGYCELSLK